MKKTCFLCYGENGKDGLFVYQEPPRNSRGEEFFVYFEPCKKDFEEVARKLFRKVISTSRLGSPAQFLQKIIDEFVSSMDDHDLAERFLSDSQIIVMLRNESDVFLLCNKAIEILHCDLDSKQEGPLGSLDSVIEIKTGVHPEQGELFENSIADYFLIYHFTMPEGNHTLIFARSREFVNRYREKFRDSVFFSSFRNNGEDGIDVETNRTFPAMHWSIPVEKRSKGDLRKRSGGMIRKWVPYAAGGLAVLAAIIFIFNPFGIGHSGDSDDERVFLSVQDEEPANDPEKGPNEDRSQGAAVIEHNDDSESVEDQFSGGPTEMSPIKIAWKEKFDAPVTSSPAIWKNQLVVGCRDAFIYSFLTDGTPKWKYQAEQGIGSSPCFSGNRVIGADYAGNIFCLNAETGSRVWNYSTGEKIIASPRVDGKIVVTGTMKGNIVALNFKDGKQIWKQRLGDGIWASPVLSDEYIIAGTTDGSLVRMNREGRIEWRVKPGGSIYSSPLLIEDRDLIIFGSGDKYVYAYSISEGSLMWRFPGGSDLRSTPVTDGKNVYIGSEDGIFYAISYAGRIVWKKNIGGAIRSKPLIMGNVILITNYNSRITVLNSANGELLDEYMVKSPVYSSPATDGKRVFFGSNQGYLYALSVSYGVI